MRNLEETLFWEIFYRHSAVRSDLAHLFGVSAPTISRSINMLLKKHLVIETGATISFRGRWPTLLQVNPELATVAGIEIDRDVVTAVVTDLCGALFGRSSARTNPIQPVQKTLQACKEALSKALADAEGLAGPISRIGVGHTGTLDVEKGLCLDWEGASHWKQVNLVQSLCEVLDTRVVLGDRAKAVALSHHLLWPEYSQHRSAIYVQVGSGIGAGIFVNGRLLRGTTSAAGEIGHIVIDRQGPLCTCGKHGCVEATASMKATVGRARQALESGAASSLRALVSSPSDLTIDMIVRAARRGDALAKSTLVESCEALGIGIANAVQLLNPSLIVLTGKFANLAGDFVLESVTKMIREQCFETIAHGLQIRLAPPRKDIAPIGCALLASLDIAHQLVQKALF